MKKRRLAILTVAAALLLSACGTGGSPSGSTDSSDYGSSRTDGTAGGESAPGNPTESENLSSENGNGGGDMSRDQSVSSEKSSGTSSRNDGIPRDESSRTGGSSAPGGGTAPSAVKAYGTDGYSPNLLVGVDKFGRAFDAVTSYKSEKQVGIFFWLWIGQPYASGVYDATKIAAMPNGQKLLYDPKYLDNSISPDGQAHFWGEPLWGYYNSMDEWVIRKQLKMLTAAEVDFLVFDTTNAVTYRDVYMRILKIITEMQKEGFNPPKAAFYTHSRSLDTVTRLYAELYKSGTYKNAWYYMNGKPMIIAYTNPADDLAEAKWRGDDSYVPKPLSKEILDFFYFKRPQWPGDPVYSDGFPWVEWKFPQPLHGNMMNVTVASHPNVPFSFSYTRGLVNWGRGWDPVAKKNVAENVEKGTFFQLQWDHALKTDPELIFVGGWNEWIAYKQIYQGEYMLCDAASLEYSRDIEPMKGGYEDSFYLQLISNIRKFKGASSKMTADPKVTIDISGPVSQWDAVKRVYRDMGYTATARNQFGVSTKIKYTEAAPRNNIQEIKVAQDNDNLYFLIKCQTPVSAAGSRDWMNIFIGTGKPSRQGWEGYTHVVNRSASGGKSSVEKLNPDFSGSETGKAEYKINGLYLQVKIPKSALGITASTASFYFKVTDKVENPEDIMNTYLSGDAVPMGRLSYKFALKDQ